MSPASGDEDTNFAYRKKRNKDGWEQVSIQLMSPASGDDFAYHKKRDKSGWFPFN